MKSKFVQKIEAINYSYNVKNQTYSKILEKPSKNLLESGYAGENEIVATHKLFTSTQYQDTFSNEIDQIFDYEYRKKDFRIHTAREAPKVIKVKAKVAPKIQIKK